MELEDAELAITEDIPVVAASQADWGSFDDPPEVPPMQSTEAEVAITEDSPVVAATQPRLYSVF
jgi:hypothetical protein